MIANKTKKIIENEVRLWSKHYLEIPNVHLNNMPACPFAKKAWLENKVDIQHRDPNIGYTRNLHQYVQKLVFPEKEILIFCDIFFKGYSLNKFQKIIDNFNNQYNKKDLYFLGFHPKNPPTDEEQEFLTNPSGNKSDLPHSTIDFSMMLVQKFSQLYEASDRLKRMGYYDKWPKEYYDDVVAQRQEQYEKLFK